MRQLVFFIVVMFLWSCSKHSAVTEIKDDFLFIQAISKEEPSNGSEQEYKIRIFPQVKQNENIDPKLKEQMLYRADSCFYRKKGNDKIFPSTVIPIANGIKNCFEYVVVFSERINKEEINCIHFESKYLNTKNYLLIFK